MKKILVLSDSHSYFDKALKIFEKEKPDIVIAAGDGIGDIDDLTSEQKSIYPKTLNMLPPILFQIAVSFVSHT